MLRIGIALALAVATAFAVDLAAQPPDDDHKNDRDRPSAKGDDDRDRPHDGDRRRGDFDGRRDMHRRGFRMPPTPVMRALDADHNGELSAKEIENASKALLSLDRNGDKQLSRDELRPRYRRPGPPREFDPDKFVERFLQRDKNKDGKISREEFPERWRERFDRIDGNGDGALDDAELKMLAKHLAKRMNRGPRDGERGERDREDRGRRDRADRPDREEGASKEDSPEDDPDSITRDDL